MFSYMKIHCAICCAEIDGMRCYSGNCCDKECYQEYDWRKTLAIINKPYYPRPNSRWDPNGKDEEAAPAARKDDQGSDSCLSDRESVSGLDPESGNDDHRA